MTTVDPELRDVLREVLAGDLLDRLDQTTSGVGFDAELWERLSRLGFTALTAPEQQGGAGAGWPEAAALLNESAAAARHLPFAESDLLAHWLLRAAGRPAADPTAPLTVAIVDPDGTARAVPWLGQVPAVLLFRRPNGTCAAAETPTPPNPDYSRDPGRSGLPRGELRGVEEPPGVVEIGSGVLDELVLRGALARGVQIVGALDEVVRLCVEHSRTRVQFGRPIAKFQTWRHRFADLETEIAAARALTYHAFRKFLAGEDALREVSMAKWLACEVDWKVADEALQVHGGYGYMMEFPVQRAWRDSRLGPIGGGTTEIMKEIIAKTYGL